MNFLLFCSDSDSGSNSFKIKAQDPLICKIKVSSSIKTMAKKLSNVCGSCLFSCLNIICTLYRSVVLNLSSLRMSELSKSAKTVNMTNICMSTSRCH